MGMGTGTPLIINRQDLRYRKRNVEVVKIMFCVLSFFFVVSMVGEQCRVQDAVL
jgi:hypothetical protein